MIGRRTAGRPDGTAAAHRLAAARRKAVALRLRRLVPGLVVGTTTLAGTGGLVAWVSEQPGLKASAASSTGAQPPVSTTAGVNPALVSAVQRQLQTEESALQALQARMAELSKQAAISRAAAASRGAAAGSGRVSSSGGAGLVEATAGAARGPTAATGSAAPLAPLPTLPAMPAYTPAPAAAAPAPAPPATTATTGASHAVP